MPSCYTKVGQTVIGRVTGRKYARKSIVSGLQNGETVSPLMYDGDSQFFEQWFEKCLIHDTDENTVFVIDPHFIVRSRCKLFVISIIVKLYFYHHIRQNLILLKKCGPIL